MHYLRQNLAEHRQFKSDSRVTAIECALVTAFIAPANVAGATAIGATLSGSFNNSASRTPI
jgi:Flp pilus assembly pilin Flp